MTEDFSHMIYCHPAYARVQSYQNYRFFKSQDGILCFEILKNEAVSLPKSPVGGISYLNDDHQAFIALMTEAEREFRKSGIQKITITQTPNYYPDHVKNDWLMREGYSPNLTEISHFIPLSEYSERDLHKMQQRKLKKNNNFFTQEEAAEKLPEVYAFIRICRAEQGLEMNIPLRVLEDQFMTFPLQHKIFTARKNGELISCVIMTEPRSHIAYYFLPATAQAHRSDSPMVSLLWQICMSYKNRNFSHIDLGISSQKGEPQTSLITFKERMGGIGTSRISWQKILS